MTQVRLTHPSRLDSVLRMNKRILVIGATGMLGEPVARRLKGDAFEVRVLSRFADKAEELFGSSFELACGDVNDKESLEGAMQGCWGVHINLRGEIEQVGVERTVEAAVKMDIQRISYISGATVSEENRWFEMVNRKYLAEKAIRESGLQFNIFCPTWFMEVLPRLVFGKRITLIGREHSPYHWLAAEDYARMVSTAFSLEDPVDKRYFIYGPQALAIEEALDRYCTTCAPHIKNIAVMPTRFARILGKITFNKGLKSSVSYMSFFEKVGEQGDPEEANSILGSPAISLDEWIKAYFSRN